MNNSFPNNFFYIIRLYNLWLPLHIFVMSISIDGRKNTWVFSPNRADQNLFFRINSLEQIDPLRFHCPNLICPGKVHKIWSFTQRHLQLVKLLKGYSLNTSALKNSYPKWKQMSGVLLIIYSDIKWSCSVMSDSVTPWTVAHQAPPSMEFSRQEYWSGLPFPFPGDLPDPEIEPGSPALQGYALPSEPPGNPALSKVFHTGS